jgi:hypothetical protein
MALHSRFANIEFFGHVSNAHLVFWIALPVAWALPTVYYNINMAPNEALPLAEVFTLLHMFIMWVCCYLATRAVARITRAYPINPALVFLLGGVLGILVLARPLLRASVALRAEWFASTEQLSRQILDAIPSYFELSPDFLLTLASIYWFRIFCWTASAWFFYSFFGKPSFGIDTSHFSPLDQAITGGSEADEINKTPQAPHFMSKVTPAIGKDLVALKAEGHYVRVYTQTGNDLIYYRFSDAIAQLSEHDGIQVHRSYWVNPALATAVKDDSGKHELHLPNDLKVPVGQTYKQNVRAAGLLS